ncbi:MAG TPA: DUF5916 domain-containing protein [Vicinamibacterales bacterium]|nr:DUF5916 domain-containing protein [Vicinamibacterales bacterium]
MPGAIHGLPTLVAIGFVVLAVLPAAAQEPQRRTATATRVTTTIRIDGRLDEVAWAAATPLTGFTQRQPDEGQPATDAMDVRILFDDDAIYVGAQMASSGTIQAPLGRRDDDDRSENIQVSLDTYLDRRTAYTFGVTASGVRLDYYYASDDEGNADATFDPVWQARTVVGTDEWTAELWIPLSQIRFNQRTPQVWGLNIRRWTPSRNEEVYWAARLRTDERFASQFGDLSGLDGIRPRRRLELLPYVAGGSQLTGAADPRDPFTQDANLTGRVGGDVKVGIGSSLTLEGTINPDFGQVDADPAEVNLTAFETFFSERRPFFIEGANLLSGVVNNYFYSRRIGAPPSTRVPGEFVDYPRTSTILGAAKLTGRMKSGTSIGVLTAVTDDAFADVSTAGVLSRIRLAPRTIFGVGRVEQEFGAPGSFAGLMATMVHRDLADGDPLGGLLTHDAVSVSGDAVVRFGDYELQSYLGLAQVSGEAPAITRLQRSSARYFQRPDAGYVEVDPLRTSMTGAKGGASFRTQNARHWSWEAGTTIESPEFETNDIGRLTSSDGLQVFGSLGYQETTPGRWLRDYRIDASQTEEWNYGGDEQVSSLQGSARLTWLNYWDTDFFWQYDFRTQDMRLTRGGPSMEKPRAWRTEVEVESSNTAPTRGGINLVYGGTEDGGLTFQIRPEFITRPAPRWELTLRPTYNRSVDTQQYVDTVPDLNVDAPGYLFGYIDRSTWSAEMRVNYTFKPDLTLDFYGEPFAASGRYDRISRLVAARTRLLAPVDPSVATPADFNFNVRSFRSNVVLRWEWRPGSTFYAVWQQNRQGNGVPSRRASAADMFRAIVAPGDHVFAVKTSFWWSPA